jgi:hypothetical protein
MIYRLLLENEHTHQINHIDIVAYNTPLGKIWQRCLNTAIHNNHSIEQADRIYGLNDEWSVEGILATLRQQYEMFEMYDHTLIPHQCDFDNIDYDNIQDFLNKLHEVFVAIMDTRKLGINQGAIASSKHPSRIIEQALLYNVLIHRCEGLLHNTKQIAVNFTRRPYHTLTADEKQCFENTIEAGEIVFKYTGTGKKLWEAFADNDVDAISNGHLVPPFDVSSDFIIKFKTSNDPKRIDQFYKWLDQHKQLLLDAGIDVSSKDVTVNHFGKVGRIIGNVDEVVARIYGSTKIVGVQKIG